MEISPHHRRQVFSFYLAHGFSDADAEELRHEVAAMRHERRWTLGAPEFEDHTDPPTTANPVDQPVRTVGGWIELYSAWPPHRASLPIDVDRSHFEEVSHLLVRLASFSREHGLDIDFQLDETYLGTIAKGELDEGLRDCLLAEWKWTIESRKSGP